MTPADLMRAVVPVFPPSGATGVRGGYLKGEKSPGELNCAPSEFFMLFDTNNDGLISFAELVPLLYVCLYALTQAHYLHGLLIKVLITPLILQFVLTGIFFSLH